MANTMRWRYGDTNPVMLPVDSATEIEIGDLVYLDTDDAKPASSLADEGSLVLNQQELQSVFVGVAMQCSRAGQTDSIRIATSGVFEFECAAATFELGALLGPAENGDGDALLDQRVAGAGTAAAALGRCAKRVAPAATRVLVDIASTVMRGGVQTPA
ncbi:hypothetical protein Mal64_13990 [Pseudobythopirellula maris]|uniref:Uncharacterized protein n=1 Tax=Pseudobythopirellula maris TaxID=2527991 RepID=A0A5C5ZUU4_9BACT|nr:hypothetical protein [Pseudobythopirellula maris]TWT91000.1 hypothetical protein Mal64_13990 [Pseudobythopirellula maris]